MGNPEQIRIKTNEPFVWPRDVRLSPADAAVTILLPGSLIGAHELVGSIIEVSCDDIRIGFRESADAAQQFECIIVSLKRGEFACLRRSTQAIVVQDESESVLLNMETLPR